MINYDIIKTELTLFLDCPVNNWLQNAALFDDGPRFGRGPHTGTTSSEDYLTKSKQGHSKGGNSSHVWYHVLLQ